MRKLIRHRLSNAAKKPPALVFAIPLAASLEYAGTHASLTRVRGDTSAVERQSESGATDDAARNDVIVPILVEKCASRLRDVGLDNDGIFRKPGAARRIAELQDIFDDPDKDYGAGFAGSDWDPYSAEDVADLLRRYLTRLPEPVIPPPFYNKFVQVAQDCTATQSQCNEDIESAEETSAPNRPMSDPESVSDPMENEMPALSTSLEQARSYAALIHDLPKPNGQLLLYLLDLLSTFAAHADSTRMSAASLAAVFHPSVLALSEGGEGLDATKHKKGQDVLERLIVQYEAIVNCV